MKDAKFKELLKNEEPKKIIYLYCTNQIYLYSKQLDKIIELKNREGKWASN